MSAYMVDRDHIRFLVSAAIIYSKNMLAFRWDHNEETRELGHGDQDRATDVGQMLWDENRKSVEERYPDTKENFSNAPGPIDENYIYCHRMWPGSITPVQVLKSIHCLEYQSCEHEGWKSSEAYSFLQTLKEIVVCKLPGYKDAKWGAPKNYQTA